MLVKAGFYATVEEAVKAETTAHDQMLHTLHLRKKSYGQLPSAAAFRVMELQGGSFPIELLEQGATADTFSRFDEEEKAHEALKAER